MIHRKFQFLTVITSPHCTLFFFSQEPLSLEHPALYWQIMNTLKSCQEIINFVAGQQKGVLIQKKCMSNGFELTLYRRP